MRILRTMVTVILLAAIWLVSFRIADLFTVFRTYSSVWFLPSGVTMAVVMAAPGWLKLVPLLAHLSLTLPPVRQVFDIEVASDLDVLIHSIRIYLIYGGTASLALLDAADGKADGQITVDRLDGNTGLLLNKLPADSGALTGDELLTVARREPRSAPGRLCEAYYYLGEAAMCPEGATPPRDRP